MNARILHVSDLHVGRNETDGVFAALRELAAELAPTLVVATGDLAHGGTSSQLERAAELLHDLGPPLLAVPGNHDIPRTVPARLASPFARWERSFGACDPVFRTPELVVAGCNSVRRWRHQGGALTEESIERAVAALAETETAFRVVALHHHLAAPPWRAARKRPLSRRTTVLRAFAAAGVDLVLGGHVHQASVTVVPEFRSTSGSLVLATAAGLGRPRPRRHGEARGASVYEITTAELTVTTLSWSGEAFARVARRSFPRH